MTRDSGGELAAYRHCRTVAAAHGRTYFLATRLLSADRRPAVHALYAFARTVDDIVDCGAPDAAGQLDRLEKRLRERLDGPNPPDPADSVLFAVADTITRYRIAPEHFWVFLDAMRMDIPGTPLFRNRYPTMTDLRAYMRGSAAAIGLQLLPVLGTVVPVAEAEPAAAALGEAFQLTNFLRDVGEDLDRGRVYLPAQELAAFGVDDELLAHCRRTAHTDPRMRRALTHLIAINRDLYRTATSGIDLLQPRVRPAIRTAAVLYAEILSEIERSDYAVFNRRAIVPTHRRLYVAARQFALAAHRA
ncbi:phytoene/squalene synthase family protein [Nocardia transvalensis]|uniref:phytoene/squalene synthase family protein n=1 Tax=Nocardia transvalensis TaxID=37333 RepID=UPI0018952447|nr:phytoene/squalene synthase family protein [Nocardia transvalensis]MBF6330183.1 phytoene/squalene synthase family protein [Nocardia transvalensis]